MIACCLYKIAREEVPAIVLVTPLWRGAPWFPMVLELCIEIPILLPLSSTLLTNANNEIHSLLEAPFFYKKVGYPLICITIVPYPSIPWFHGFKPVRMAALAGVQVGVEL